jgi:hypothetical protein
VDGQLRRAGAVVVLERQPERLDLGERLGSMARDLNDC